jgi:hypothetical protein
VRLGREIFTRLCFRFSKDPREEDVAVARLGAFAGLVLCWLVPASVQAGLYCTEALPRNGFRIPAGGIKKIDTARFQSDFMPELRRLVLDPTYSLRQEYQERINRLKALKAPMIDDQINLSFYYIRLGQAQEAVSLLRIINPRGPDSFMVYSNLATAHQMLAGAGDNPKANLLYARSYLKDSLRSWPKERPGWTAGQLHAYREAEQYQQKLIEVRRREASSAAGTPRIYSDVDAIFPISFNFTQESGKYRAGKPPSGEEAKLNGNEMAITKQLLAWLPADNRLYWLLGELANASGDFQASEAFLDELVYRQKLDVPLLKDHWQVLREASRNAAKPPTASPTWMPDLGQTLVVCGIGGLIFLILAYFQIREIRRRRRKAPGAASRSNA